MAGFEHVHLQAVDVGQITRSDFGMQRQGIEHGNIALLIMR
jgi:hypothetical protein